jgi:hypothetical protein
MCPTAYVWEMSKAGKAKGEGEKEWELVPPFSGFAKLPIPNPFKYSLNFKGTRP